jgi:hypothetical protein
MLMILIAALFLLFFVTLRVLLVSHEGDSTDNGSGSNDSKSLGSVHLDNWFLYCRMNSGDQRIRLRGVMEKRQTVSATI